MPSDLRYDKERNILNVFLSGEITIDDFDEIMDSITHSDEFPADVPTLWDLCEVDVRNADTSVIEKVIGVRTRYPERGKTKLALLASSELAFGLSRMYEALSADLPQTVGVFRDRAEAQQWLEENDLS
jgi:hypothetical protein